MINCVLHASCLQITRTPAEDDALQERMKAQVKCFKSSSDVHRYQELKGLKNYLNYRIACTTYEAQLAASASMVDKMRRKHVDAQLLKFDLAEKAQQESQKWHWSPIYQIFKKWPLPNFVAAPWDHTQSEWVELSAVLLENMKSEPLSLEAQCPHILRALLYLVRTLRGNKRPLAHPTKGLDLQYMLELVRGKEYSVALSVIVQGLPHEGWPTFPGIQDAVDTFSDLHSDTVALLGYNPSKQVAVVEKIQAFLGRIAHRAIADMVRMHCDEQLAQLWYQSDTTEHLREKCEDVSQLFFYIPVEYIFCNILLLCKVSSVLQLLFDVLHAGNAYVLGQLCFASVCLMSYMLGMCRYYVR